jgi:pimeloyl-ACP methyl ester carboxylesterase
VTASKPASKAPVSGGELTGAAPDVGAARWLEPDPQRRPQEQTPARYPDAEGFVERDGVRIFWERYGEGEPTVLLLPTWSIVHSRSWKNQIPFLARHMRVVTFDGRGNGRSDRPMGTEAYAPGEFAADALAVLDATGTRHAALAAVSCGALWATRLAAEHPERVDRIAYIGPAAGLAPGHPERLVYRFDERYDENEAWARYNCHYWLRDYPGFLEFFFAQCINEPHSTKQIEDCVGWALETSPEVLVDTAGGLGQDPDGRLRADCRVVQCPTLIIHGDRDLIRPHAQGEALARATGGQLVTLSGAGHLPNGRDPVVINHLLAEFILSPAPPRRWTRGRGRTRRALFISPPIGLGHARRDVAIAAALRELHPDLEIDWLAQDPVTRVLEARGERIHPASAELASESGHLESEAGDHRLPVFGAIRRMDEILAANFMVFHDLVRDQAYDLWIGDEAWEIDYFLHENPELKTAAYVWLTDFVGWLPAPGADAREAMLTADLNAEMLEQIARYPRLRDRSIFIGEPEDIVPEHFGPGLPQLRYWTQSHFDFVGYVSGFDPARLADRPALRAELGYRSDERVCIVTVGGSGVGVSLLRRVIAAWPEARRLVPGLRMVLVAGPRIDPATLGPAEDGLEIRPYVHDLYRHLAACDLAITQGGLATTMELTASRVRSSTSRSGITSSSGVTSRTASVATAQAGAWISSARRHRTSPQPSRRRLTVRLTIGRSPSMGRAALLGSSATSCRSPRVSPGRIRLVWGPGSCWGHYELGSRFHDHGNVDQDPAGRYGGALGSHRGRDGRVRQQQFELDSICVRHLGCCGGAHRRGCAHQHHQGSRRDVSHRRLGPRSLPMAGRHERSIELLWPVRQVLAAGTDQDNPVGVGRGQRE